MAKSAMIRARTESVLKHDVQKILHKTTLKAMKDVHTKQNLSKAHDLEDLFKKLGI